MRLHSTPDMGAAGEAGRVMVEDIKPMTVVTSGASREGADSSRPGNGRDRHDAHCRLPLGPNCVRAVQREVQILGASALAIRNPSVRLDAVGLRERRAAWYEPVRERGGSIAGVDGTRVLVDRASSRPLDLLAELDCSL